MQHFRHHPPSWFLERALAKFKRLVLRFDGKPSKRSFTYHEVQKAFEIGINVGVLKTKVREHAINRRTESPRN